MNSQAFTTDVFAGNLRRMHNLMDEDNLDLLVLGSPSNIIYATGIRGPSGILALTRNCVDKLVVPLLDYWRALEAAPRGMDILVAYRGGEEAIAADVPSRKIVKGGLLDAAAKIVEECDAKRVAADLSQLPHSMAKGLVEKIGAEDYSKKISMLRSVKSREEIELIEQAVRIAEEAFRRAYDYLHEGVTEAEVAGLVFSEIMRLGGWYEAFPTIVAFYSNTAFPHHTPTTLQLGVEGPILIDWGAVYAGYRSDSTRTFWLKGSPSQKFKEHLEAVWEAQGEAIDTISAGVEAWEPDRAARRVLEKYGLEKYFIHGLGHGVGVDIHEEPYLRPGSKTVLEKNMVVTIEPGIYLPGMYGIRIEDLAVVTASGLRLLTKLPRILP